MEHECDKSDKRQKIRTLSCPLSREVLWFLIPNRVFLLSIIHCLPSMLIWSARFLPELNPIWFAIVFHGHCWPFDLRGSPTGSFAVFFGRIMNPLLHTGPSCLYAQDARITDWGISRLVSGTIKFGELPPALLWSGRLVLCACIINGLLDPLKNWWTNFYQIWHGDLIKFWDKSVCTPVSVF